MKGYMTEEQAEKKYGKAMLKKMEETGYLTSITVLMVNGKAQVPVSDYDRAYRAAKGKKIHPLECD